MARRGTRWTTAALVGGLAGWNVVQNRMPRTWYGQINGIGVLVALAVGRRLGLTHPDLGTGPASLRRGLIVGGPPAAVVLAATAVLSTWPRTRSWFRDERVERAGLGNLAIEALFRIPVGTALFEEVAFRGLLSGWLHRHHHQHARIGGALAFGLWHILPTRKMVEVYRDGALAQSPARGMAMVSAAVVATGAAGAVFDLLRTRSGSVIAPTLVHAALNVGAFAAAWHAAPPHRPQ